MKTKSTLILLTTGALILGTFSFIHAEEKGTSKGRPDARGKGDGSFLKTLDKDGDKAISKEEAGERWERLGKLDTDGDNSVSMKEMMAARGGSGKGRPEGKPGEKPEGKPGERPEGKPEERSKGAPGKGAPGEMFKRADKNEDGKISKDEVPEQIWARLGKLDKDGDGAVSGEEAKAGRPEGGRPGGPGGGPPSKEEAAARFKRADKNGDGKLGKDEVSAEHWERLGKLDKNGDNAVSKEEMAAMAAMMRQRGEKGPGGKGGPQGGPGAMFEKFDKDKDGKLAESEVPAEMWAKVRKADDNADGLVSKAEMDKVMSQRDGKKPEGAKPEGGKKKKKRPALEGDKEA